MKLIIINGPNLNLLGIREKEIYGETSFEEYLSTLKSKFKDVELEFFQSNHEGEFCLLYTSPSPRDDELSRMPSSA